MAASRRCAGRTAPDRTIRRLDCERLQRRPPARNQHWADSVTRPQRVLTIAAWISAAVTATLGVMQAITGQGVLYIGLINRVQAGDDLTGAAHGAGFADSAHLTRTTREMFGLPPSVLSRHVSWDLDSG